MQRQAPPPTPADSRPAEIESRLRDASMKVISAAGMKRSAGFDEEWGALLRRAARRMVDDRRVDESQLRLAVRVIERLADAVVAHARTRGLTTVMKAFIAQAMSPPTCPSWPLG